jgi:hypothetical protein
MSHRQNDNDDEFFEMHLTDAQTNNLRIAVRYIRTDIMASLTKSGLLSLSKQIPVKLLDISSKGAAIDCEKKLGIKRKIILELIFNDNQSFTLHAKIIHKLKNKKQYGLQFDKFNHELGDYLLATQNDLTFK